MVQYRFPRRPESCCTCQRAFEPGEELISIVYPAPEEEEAAAEQEAAGVQEPVLLFERRDHCLACAPPEEEQAYSRWRTRCPAPKDRAPARIDATLVFEFFQRLSARDDPATAGYLYFLALYLMRRRVLKFIDSETRDDREVWILESRPAGERFEVADPGLDAEALEAIRVHIMDALSAGEMEL
jgi:hypothetical protein